MKYICKTCGLPHCIYEVPDRVNDRIDLPTVCPWITDPPRAGKKYKKAKWIEATT